MKITLNISDDLYETLEREALLASKAVKTTAEEIAANKLARFAVIPNSERIVTIWGTDRLKLEAIFQTTIDDSEKLYQMLRNVASLKIGTIERIFSPGEVIRLTDQARFHGWTIEKFLELTSNEALDYVMNRL